MYRQVIDTAAEKMQKTTSVLQGDLRSIRAGRANPQLLERVVVDYYGVQTPLTQMGNITAPEPRMLVVSVWDQKALPLVENLDGLAERFRDINPDVVLDIRVQYVDADNIPTLLDEVKPDFIVDAIDTIQPKCHLIVEAWRRRIKIVSSMGAGAKSDITQIRLSDLWDTYHCGLAKAVRNGLKRMGMKRSLPVVFSTEQARPEAIIRVENEQNKKSTTGTVSYMPATFGCFLAGYVIKSLEGDKGK